MGPTADIVSMDVEAIVAALRERAGESLYTVVEFDADSFNTVYVSPAAREFYEDEAAMQAHFSDIHAYVHLDLVEQDLFTTELFPLADEVRYVSTAMDYLTVVRVYADGEGIFFAVEEDTLVPELVGAIENAL
jgi:quinol monooxygenase YgiN